jgi:hypothetical protein
MMTKVITKPTEHKWWLRDVEDHDFDAALNYLSLRLKPGDARDVIREMRKAEVTLRRPNDILRASKLPALPMSDPGVHRDLMKLLHGEKLSPVLIMDLVSGTDIADGYHRVSLMYNIDPFMYMPLRIG